MSNRVLEKDRENGKGKKVFKYNKIFTTEGHRSKEPIIKTDKKD